MEDKVLRLADDFNLYKADFGEKKCYLFNVADGAIFNLNEVSHTMLSHFDGKKSVREVFIILKKMYNVEEARLREDFFSLVDEWIEEKILIEKEK